MIRQHNDNIIDKVQGVQFSIWSPDQIEKNSVAEIFTQETYDGNYPKIGGLFDSRLGVLEHNTLCPTDMLNNK